MQTALLQQMEKEGAAAEPLPDDPAKIVIPETYVRPQFRRRKELGADVHDVLFTLHPDDMFSSPEVAAAVRDAGASGKLKTFRIILAKPLVGMNLSGHAVAKLLAAYPLASIQKQLILIFDDLNTLPGSIALQSGGELRSAQGHKGAESVVEAIGTSDFVRFRIGIGRPTPPLQVASYVLQPFSKEAREMDLLGHALDLSAQALQHYAGGSDFKATKKKFASSRKIPKNLRKMEGLIFPVEVVP
ncbi:peptidyl-tRNA hydrolase-domain-containing protein [Blyttiomyces helicus]|uniref:Peptidyl-tRNA hydrolase-domain-containing protein n=1 Tax=Blyttiomyces helicus TaxID=388810 RepID=A0A4P9VX88_9FUNG|nr:peptidyl-tRNA hydrolase-domain-containing protein [Blyttiomyces helicus]|eukprot:RKO84339.1 peptidyl-tRNA hydrolase-domain-containing protein [Blyttiomyces helicus]